MFPGELWFRKMPGSVTSLEISSACVGHAPMWTAIAAAALSFTLPSAPTLQTTLAASPRSPPLQLLASRRDALSLGLGALAFAPLAANADGQDPNDLSRLKKGLESIDFLLANWDKETVDPISGDDSPDRVRYFVGLRTTDHPLFQVDKLLTKAQQKLPDDADIELWIDTVEGFNSCLAKINELAYTSSFGEYNPGGGKGQVRKYLLLAQEQVVEAEKDLKAIITILNI